MGQTYFEKAGSLISPGDLLDALPYVRVPKPLRVARKVSRTLPKHFQIQGELREILEVGKHDPSPFFNFEPPGEEVLSNAKMSGAVFLTWGSEVEDDERGGKLHKKDWLIAPFFSLANLDKEITDSRTGVRLNMAQATREGKSPKFFPLPPFPGEESAGYYADFRKICPLAASHFQKVPRNWRLSARALNDFYHHLLWFFTRKKIFFSPVSCEHCGYPVDLGIVFQGQPLEPPDE